MALAVVHVGGNVSTSVSQAEADSGRRRDLLTSDEREELERLRKENAELKRANAILKDTYVCFATELDPTRRRAATSRSGGTSPGVEPICRAIGVAGEHALPHRSRKPFGRALEDWKLVADPRRPRRLLPRLRGAQDLKRARAARSRDRP
jgi:hypothetical protein